ncbi:uncharacterized protein [Malus domestica]|uniref:uncharacterized protein n=1 Tax=Malus domestica TaxID=3750 RepID=UPI003975708C
MTSLEDSAVLKLEGSSRTPTNKPILNPVIIQNDTPAVPNTVKLNGSNYPLWSKVLEKHAGRDMKGFVTGSTKEPAENSVKYEMWETGNAIELDQRRPIKMECAMDLKTLQEEIQIDRVYAFLEGLDDIFHKVRSDILRTQPLPFVEEVFYVVWCEAQRHATMMDGSNNQEGLTSMAMVSRPTTAFRSCNRSNQSLKSRSFTREKKDDFKCTFCGQTHHTKDMCFAKHGVPDWFPKLKKKLRANERGSVGNNGGCVSLDTTQLKAKEAETISNDPSQTLLTRSTYGDPSSTVGIVGHVLLASDPEHHIGWILDFGATDHMTYDKNVFQYMTTSHREYITTADGTHASVVGAGTDIQTKEIIECGTKREGLYYVDDVFPDRAHAVRVLRDSNLQEVCHRASFPPSMSKRPFPFDLVHSNVWGPSPVVTSSGLWWFVTFVDDCTRITWLYMLKNKSDVGAIFRSFAQMVQA